MYKCTDFRLFKIPFFFFFPSHNGGCGGRWIGGMIKGRQCAFVPEIALCSSEGCEMYCCMYADNEKERFLGKFLISKMLFN